MSTIDKVFEDEGIVPDVVSVPPTLLIKVRYPSGAEVNKGAELTPTQVKDVPDVEWPAETSNFYTVAMVDPDAPSREDPKYREVMHWLVGNVPGPDISEGETLFEYIGSGPPEGTGLHRYVFLVYQQQGKIQFTEKKITNRSRENRLGFSIAKFAEKYNLGIPIAGNFYQAQYDDYVPLLHKQLSGSP